MCCIICKTISSKENELENITNSIIYSFLNLNSDKFASIAYDSLTIFNGERRNSREVFVDLFKTELYKTTPFRDVSKTTNVSIPQRDNDVLKGLALHFNLNIVVGTIQPAFI